MKGWFGNSQKHSLASRGIRLNDRRESLKSFNPRINNTFEYKIK